MRSISYPAARSTRLPWRNRYGAIDFASRRAFLRAMGAGTLAAPFVPLLEAQAQQNLTRLIVMTWHNGVGEVPKYYPTGSGTNFTMGSTMNSLEPYKRDIIFFKDFQGRYMSDEAGVHPMASANLLTGSPATRPSGGTIFERQDATRATSISIDQHVANLIGRNSIHKSLVLGAGADPYAAGDHIGGSVSYRGPSDPIIAEPDVFVTFDRLFAGFANQMAPTSAMTVDPRRGDDRSILDLVAKNLEWLKGRVGQEDLRRVDAHLEGIRDIERRLPALGADTPSSGAGGGGQATCAAPGMPPRDNRVAFHTRNPGRFMPQIVQAQVDMTLAAMVCDLTRVSLMQTGVTTALWPPQFIGVNVQIHDISHNDVPTMTRLTQTVVRETFAYLLKRLNEVQEAGQPLMRRVGAVWANEFSDGARHRGSPVPFILAGQAGGKWQTGRYIQFPSIRRHTDLLVSIARTFGDNATKFGTDPTAGPVSELGV